MERLDGEVTPASTGARGWGPAVAAGRDLGSEPSTSHQEGPSSRHHLRESHGPRAKPPEALLLRELMEILTPADTS